MKTPSSSYVATRKSHTLHWYGGGLILLLLAFVQLLWPVSFLQISPGGFPIHFGWGCLLLLTPVLLARIALSAPELPPQERNTILLLCSGGAFVCEVVHFWVVDQSLYALFQSSGYRSNTEWQYAMHCRILALDPAHIPHCYRFLPDCIVGWYQWLCGSFEIARSAYRLQCNALFFVFAYRLARSHMKALPAAGVVLLVAALYPIGILRYAGQFVDPLSHLSFAACFYFLAVGHEAGFGTSLVLGLFAKESVIVMAVCRCFYGSDRRAAIRSALVHLAVGVAILVSIRLWVTCGSTAYASISKVSPEHFITNLRLWQFWAPFYLATIGFLLPGTILGWKRVSAAFRATTVVVGISLIISSLCFSWLQEARNLAPLVLAMAVFNLKYASHRLQLEPD
ncbi:MAG TPA: hypothetical protein VK178_04295 [Opitutaceae bacterium]|nr:hypothetical protein [Opitutaceae bacterium]